MPPRFTENFAPRSRVGEEMQTRPQAEAELRRQAERAYSLRRRRVEKPLNPNRARIEWIFTWLSNVNRMVRDPSQIDEARAKFVRYSEWMRFDWPRANAAYRYDGFASSTELLLFHNLFDGLNEFFGV